LIKIFNSYEKLVAYSGHFHHRTTQEGDARRGQHAKTETLWGML